MLSQNIEWSDEDEAKIDAVWEEIAAERAAYPAIVLRYGDAGKDLFDAEVRVLMRHGDSEAAARAFLADPEVWQTFVLARNLEEVQS